jgi:tetratricopeptide (TPR) repeat protein
MLNIGRIDIAEEKFQEEIKKAHERHKKRPDTWAGNESLGRVLYLMGDSNAKNYLRKAIEIRSPMVQKNGNKGWELIVLGNYHRLINDLESAQQYFQEAYEDQKGRVGNIEFPKFINYTEIQHLIVACFLLRRFKDATVYSELLSQSDPDPRLLANSLGSLSQAFLSGDINFVEVWLTDLEEWIRSAAGSGEFSSTGGVGALDFYEIVLEMLNEMQTRHENNSTNI